MDGARRVGNVASMNWQLTMSAAGFTICAITWSIAAVVFARAKRAEAEYWKSGNGGDDDEDAADWWKKGEAK
jgi:hypothetical protein